MNRFNGNFSFCMYKILFLSMSYVYKACNPTILNYLYIKKKDKFRIVGLQAQIIYTRHFWICNLYVFVTSTVFLIVVWFLFYI